MVSLWDMPGLQAISVIPATIPGRQLLRALMSRKGPADRFASMNETADDAIDRDFRRRLQQLGNEIEAGAGFCAPDSVFWRVNREPALLLVGMRALLMQIAHPKVAQGVADHSRYREDPLGRGIRTFSAMYSIIFGERDEATAVALRVRTIHNRVHGRVADPLPVGIPPDYDANDPELLFWVWATLLDSAVIAYEYFVTPLDSDEKDQFLREARPLAALFGISTSLYPENWLVFEAWMVKMLDSGTLTVTPTARRIFRNLLAGTWFTRLLSPFNYAMAAMLLPQCLVGMYGIKRNLWARGLFLSMVWATRLLLRLTPRGLRGIPAARRGERRYRQRRRHRSP
jgi:uncharacterized protein (DUF2236 family)